jgi:predicted nucleic acid-binding protein
MAERVAPVIYWDTSAVLSALFKDSHTGSALNWAQKSAHHLISSLAYAEAGAVISRMRREGILTDESVDSALGSLDGGPWQYLNLSPDRQTVRSLAGKVHLRGADLWHLAAAKTLQTRLPEIHLLTFDRLLETAAREEGL